jgi:Predicted membrane protein
MSLTTRIITRLWQKPRLISDDKPRMESWLELFYDVTFVAVVAALAKRLADDISWMGFIEFVFLYIPVWWAWFGSTMYNNRFESDDASHRIFTFLKMLPVGGMAITVQGALEEYAVGFALSYIGARLILVYLWYRAGSSSSA